MPKPKTKTVKRSARKNASRKGAATHPVKTPRATVHAQPPPDLANAKAIAEHFNIHSSTVYRAHERGELEAWCMVASGSEDKPQRPLFRMDVARNWILARQRKADEFKKQQVARKNAAAKK